jgi:hypothetical protein
LETWKNRAAKLRDTLKEKEAARKENLELQTLCEELMGIVEGNAK